MIYARTRSCARANDAKIVRSRDAQCNTKGRTIRKVMGGVGKKNKKKLMQGKMPRKKIRAKKKVKKKNFMQKEGPTPGPAIFISIINKDI